MEDAVETGTQQAAPVQRRGGPIGLQIRNQAPDQSAHTPPRGTVMLGECIQLVHQPLRVDPTQRVANRWERCRPHPSLTRTNRFPASGWSWESFAPDDVAVDDPAVW